MRTYGEINERIRQKKAVVYTAEEVIDLVRSKGPEKAAEKVDVVTTGTFGAMCSSGAFLNFGHSDPPIRMTDIRLNGVEAYGGLAAVDAYIGSTAVRENSGESLYGGGHVIEELIAGNRVRLRAWGPGTDCYVRKDIDTYVTLDDLNEAYMFNPRNVYQNYSAATNTMDRTLYTYMGKLLPRMKNITYSTSGQLSPLLNDPHLDTIGGGTRIFLGGGEGYVAWQGTQYNTAAPERNGVPVNGSRTLALMGDMKQMDHEFVRGMDVHRYGTSIAIGVGIPIPILNADVMKRAAVSDEDLYTTLVDYSVTEKSRASLGQYSYAELRSGTVDYEGHKIRTSPLSSYRKARRVAEKLKDWIENGEFLLTEPIFRLPDAGTVKPLEVRR